MINDEEYIAFTEKHSDSPMLVKHLQPIMKGIAATLKAALGLRDSRLDAIEAKLAALETNALRPEYMGAFEEGKTYPRSALVTHRNGLWLALSDTTLRPASNPTAWKMISRG